MLRVSRWYLDPANHEEVVATAARLTKQPPERFADWIFTRGDYYRDRNLRPNVAALQASIELQRELGFLKAPLDIRKHLALDLVDEAARRLD
jgi:NitT/TauT family transport system substrate-binding protein